MRKPLAPLSLLSLFLLAACSSGGPVDTSPQTLGSPTAPVTIQEFSDLQCPYCATISPLVEALVRNNPEKLRLEFYHFPLPGHEYALPAAQASECAAKQGKFWEYVKEVFKGQEQLNEDLLFTISQGMNLDQESFKACMQDKSVQRKALLQARKGSQLGVDSTPTFIVNGQLVGYGKDFDAYVLGLANGSSSAPSSSGIPTGSIPPKPNT